MPPTRRRVAALGTMVVVVIVSLTVLLARASLGTVPLYDFTPTAFVYAPAVFRDCVPPTATLTATPTSTPTPIPTHARFYLCCFDDLLETCPAWCGAVVGYLGPGERFAWEQDSGLSMDIAGTTYQFGIAASSPSTTTFEVELYLIQPDEELLLASTPLTVESSTPNRYVLFAEGVDPAVAVNEDRLKVRITNVSGARAPIYCGDPDRAEAGGSYIEFPRSR